MNLEQHRKWLSKKGWTAIEGALLLADIDPDAETRVPPTWGPAFNKDIKGFFRELIMYSGSNSSPGRELRREFLTREVGYWKCAFSGVAFLQLLNFVKIFAAFWGAIEKQNNAPWSEELRTFDIISAFHFYDFSDLSNEEGRRLIDIEFPIPWFYEFAKNFVSTASPNNKCPQPLALNAPIFGLVVEGSNDSGTAGKRSLEEISQLQANIKKMEAQIDQLKAQLAAVAAERDELRKQQAAAPSGGGAGEDDDLGRGVTVQDVRELLKTTKEQAGAAATLPLAAMIEAFVHVRRYGSNRNGTNAAIRDYLKKNFVGEDGKCIFSQNVQEAMGKVSNWRVKPGRPQKKTED
ncbi:hypothetical protein MUN46_004795 [Mesosutterella sp. AGMB02718]|uniref:Uncharacterized protein n=1 Tax=Mesosutterella faecium TaxID=2925194 RepID=A0ABT7IMS6_9BURK|nr:hypothetical protein [Mesosutterella sp. AGMB02718]MDL2059250.1 hypothetical protein [Mesosutterella sp. AGMB02718]